MKTNSTYPLGLLCSVLALIGTVSTATSGVVGSPWRVLLIALGVACFVVFGAVLTLALQAGAKGEKRS